MFMAIMFELLHGDIRIVPSSIVWGIALAYIAYKSGCIYGNYYHILHNGMSAIYRLYPSNLVSKKYDLILFKYLEINISNIIIILALIIIGIILLKPSRKIKVKKINNPVAEIASE